MSYKCSKINISRYIDNDLPQSEGMELLEHLRLCPSCMRYYKELKAVTAEMPALLEKAPKDLKEKVLNRIDVLAPESKKRAGRFRFPYFTAAAVACIAIFALLGGRLLNAPKSADDNTRSAQDASYKMAQNSQPELAYGAGIAANEVQMGQAQGLTEDGARGEMAAPPQMAIQGVQADFFKDVPVSVEGDFSFIMFARVQGADALNKFLETIESEKTQKDGYTYIVVPQEQNEAVFEKLMGIGAQTAYGSADNYKIKEGAKTGLLIIWAQ